MPLTDTLWPWAFGAVCLLLVLRCAARQRHPVLAVLAGAVCGLGVLAVIVVGLGTYFSHRFVERTRTTVQVKQG